MSACVSPPQESVSHIVQVAAIIAHAASTALPPFWKIIAPAVAASGLPVIASHLRACRGGLFVAATATAHTVQIANTTPVRERAPHRIRPLRDLVIAASSLAPLDWSGGCYRAAPPRLDDQSAAGDYG